MHKLQIKSVIVQRTGRTSIQTLYPDAMHLFWPIVVLVYMSTPEKIIPSNFTCNYAALAAFGLRWYRTPPFCDVLCIEKKKPNKNKYNFILFFFLQTFLCYRQWNSRLMSVLERNKRRGIKRTITSVLTFNLLTISP